MSVSSERGKAGEERVCAFLKKHGWKIAARNYRIKGGEIDIVAENDKTIAFIEVKSRKFGSLTSGAEAVDKAKRAAVIKTADRYLERFPCGDKQVRFDVAEVTLTTEEIPRVLELEYTADAFDAFMP